MGVPIPDYSDYLIFEDGRVFSKKTNKFLRPNITTSGYHTVELFNAKGSKRFLIHRLVAKAFVENPYNLPQVNHKDENKANNSVENLEWCTAFYNMNYGTCQERAKRHTDYTKEIYKINARINGAVRSRKVIQLKNNQIIAEYNSINEAFRKTKILHIGECANGLRKTAGGYSWQFRR